MAGFEIMGVHPGLLAGEKSTLAHRGVKREGVKA
jgi:hypothetical protein